jgi:D-alanyl-D-alanine carboxypeptidase (penicillin-binding protein 5/6)
MTVLLTLEHARPIDVVTVAPQAAGVGESTINLRPGERITVHDLLEAALVQSANDAADALAYYVGRGDVNRFVAMMNARARQLGLADTHYSRPDGLDAPAHYSSARDVTKLARLLMRRPIVRQIVRQQTATISGGRVLHTWNDLLATFPGVIGVKTGHTSAAGWNEVAALQRPGIALYATILGSPDRGTRNADLTTLLRLGLAHFGRVTIVGARPCATLATEFGRARVRLVPRRPLVAVVRVDKPLVLRVVAPAAVELPVQRRQPLGRVFAYEQGRFVGWRTLVAARAVSRPGVGGRVGWYAGRTVHHVLGWVS